MSVEHPGPPPIPAPERARMYAGVVHGAQVYNDEVPYTVHLERVVGVLERFGYTDPAMLCAGWLHDAIEDTTANYNSIKDRFGVEVAELVYAVTSELGRNRKERNAKTYPKIRGNDQAIALKLADRIANVEYGLANGGGMVAKYAQEFPAFQDGIRPHWQSADARVEDPRTTRMWNHLAMLSKTTTTTT